MVKEVLNKEPKSVESTSEEIISLTKDQFAKVVIDILNAAYVHICGKVDSFDVVKEGIKTSIHKSLSSVADELISKNYPSA
mgnify:CR=1 FL=1